MNSPEARFNLDEVLARPERRMRRLPTLVARSYRLVWNAARREFASAAALQLLSGVAVAIQLLVLRGVFRDLLSIRDNRFDAALPDLAALMLLTSVVTVAGVVRAEQQRLVGELVSRYASAQVINAATHASLLAYEDPSFHDRLQRASVNAAVRPLQVANGVLGLASTLPAIAGIGLVLFVLEPLFLALVITAYVPVWLAATTASRAFHAYTVRQTERDRRRTYLYLVLTRKDEAAEVRGFGFAPWMQRQHDVLYDERISDLRSLVRRRLRLGLIGGLASSAILATTMAALVWMVSTGRTPLSSAAAAAGAVVLLGQRLQGLASSANALFEGSLFVEDFTSFISSWAESDTAAHAEPLPPFSTLAVEGVTFTYPSSSRLALDDVSFEIRRGEVVALVGENGSGKTTLAKVLAGLYPPSEGTVRWDGRPVDELDPQAVRASMTVLFQDFARYNLAVVENIGLGRYQGMDDRASIVRAAQQAGVDGAIDGLPDGYETWLGPEFYGGHDLSIGQWQRLALARAFFRDAPLVILDEPTSALDPRAEAELFESIRSQFSGRSVLLISHRFSSVRSADTICVLERGKIIERGTHNELIAADGLYAELFTMQAAAYLRTAT